MQRVVNFSSKRLEKEKEIGKVHPSLGCKTEEFS